MCGFCRCWSPGCLCHTRISVCPSTLRDPQSRVLVCTNCDHMAFVHQFHWCIQHLPLESPCLSSTLSVLHVQIFKEDPKGRLDVLGRYTIVYDRYESLYSKPSFHGCLVYLLWHYLVYLLKARKLCLLILDTFHNCQFRYIFRNHKLQFSLIILFLHGLL